MTRDNAEQFCQSHCFSNLASIHTRVEYDTILDQINVKYPFNHLSTNSVWFGLNGDKYIDNTTFDYATNTSIFPWHSDNSNSLNTSDCVELAGDGSYNYEWMNAVAIMNKDLFVMSVNGHNLQNIF